MSSWAIASKSALGDVDVELRDVNDEPVGIALPSEFAELLREAYGFLNFSTFMADFRAR